MRAADVLGDNVILQISEIGMAVRQARIRRGLKREELAAALAVSQSTVRRIEAGDTGVAMGAYLSALCYISPKLVSVMLAEMSNEPAAMVEKRRPTRRPLPRVHGGAKNPIAGAVL